MPLIAEDKGGFKQIEPGTYTARCYSVIDLGTQRGEYLGEATVNHQVLVGWEIPSELMEDGQPCAISKFYTLSLGEKANLCKDLTSWRGKAFSDEEKKGFDIFNLVGVACMISVIKKDNGKSAVATVSKMPKGMEAPDQINESVKFSIDEFLAGDNSVYDAISDGIKTIINRCDELNKQNHNSADPFADSPDFGDVPVDDDDTIPF